MDPEPALLCLDDDDDDNDDLPPPLQCVADTSSESDYSDGDASARGARPNSRAEREKRAAQKAVVGTSRRRLTLSATGESQSRGAFRWHCVRHIAVHRHILSRSDEALMTSVKSIKYLFKYMMKHPPMIFSNVNTSKL